MGEGGRALDQLRGAADTLISAAPALGSDEELLAEFRNQLNRCELAFALATRPLADRCREDFELSPIQILRHECRMASGAAGSAVEVGEMLDRLPESRAALEEGRIGFAHLTLIAYTAEFAGGRFREADLLGKAEALPVTSFAGVCRHYRHTVDPEHFAEDERRLHDARFLELTTRAEDGAVWFRGLLDAEAGAHLRTAVESLAQPLPQDHRTVGQRRADALTEISRGALDEGRVPVVNGVRPHVQVTATLQTLLGMPGAPAAVLEGSGPISNEMLRRLAGDCSVRRVLLDENSLVIDVGRERRLFRGATRLAVEMRDGGCVWRGCTRPARFCQTDHGEPWWAGGKTTKENGRLLCMYHHRLRSEGWRLIETADGWIPHPPLWALRPHRVPDD